MKYAAIADWAADKRFTVTFMLSTSATPKTTDGMRRVKPRE